MPTEVTIPPDNQLYVPVFKPGDRFYKKNLYDLFKNLISEDDLGNVILPVYDTTISYTVGDYCIHDKKLYQCTTATTGTWDSHDWTDEDGSGNKLNILNVIFDGISAANLLSVPKYEGDLKSLISLFYSKSNSYAVGDIIIKEVTENNKQVFKLYYCKTAVAANENWNDQKWQSFKLGQIFNPTGPGLVPPTGGDLNKVLFSNGTWATLINYVTMSDLSYLIADEYDETATYHVGDYVTYNDSEHKYLYICKVDTSDPAGTMDNTKWDPVNLTNIFSGTIPGLVPNAPNSDKNKKVLGGNGNWLDLPEPQDLSNYITESNLNDIIADQYDSSVSYSKNDYVIYNKELYRCKVNSTTAGEWDEDHWSDSWQRINIARIFDDAAPGLVPSPTQQDITDNKVLGANGNWIPQASAPDLSNYITESNLGDIVADVFSTSDTYALGRYVIYDKKLYRCKVAVTTAGDWTGSANWDMVNLTNFISSLPNEVSDNEIDSLFVEPQQGE